MNNRRIKIKKASIQIDPRIERLLQDAIGKDSNHEFLLAPLVGEFRLAIKAGNASDAVKWSWFLRGWIDYLDRLPLVAKEDYRREKSKASKNKNTKTTLNRIASAEATLPPETIDTPAGRIAISRFLLENFGVELKPESIRKLKNRSLDKL